MSLRFLHLADVHLDTPFQNKEPHERQLLREALRRAFQEAISLAINHQVDALLIAGDLFDNETLSFSTEKYLLQQLEKLHQVGIRVFYTPGNHDPYGSNYRLSRIPWPANVHIYKQADPETVSLKDDQGEVKAYIVGAGHEGSREKRNLAQEFPQAEGDIPFIGVLHTYVGGYQEIGEHERYAPCSVRDLLAKNYAYWALGHIHQGQVVHEDPFVVYAGSLMGRNIREEGIKGAYLVEIEGKNVVQAKFIPLASVCWLQVTLADLANITQLKELEKRIKDTLSEIVAGYAGLALFIRLLLKGPCPLYYELADEVNIATLAEEVALSLELSHLEISAEGILRPLCIADYQDKPHVVSTVLELITKLKEDDELLANLAPSPLAKSGVNNGQDELTYLRKLLTDLEPEVVARLVEVKKR